MPYSRDGDARFGGAVSAAPTAGYAISTDRELLDLDVIHGYLTRSYWASGIPRALVERSLQHSLCFGVYRETEGARVREQVGFARVVTDYAAFAYLADVFILEGHRGRGLSKHLMRVIMDHPGLQGLRRFLLATRDAHGLYRQFGFHELARPGNLMEIYRPDLYTMAADVTPTRPGSLS